MELLFLLAKGLRFAAAFSWALATLRISRGQQFAHGPQLARQARMLLAALGVCIVGYLLTPFPIAFGWPHWLIAIPLSLGFAAPFFLWMSASAVYQSGFQAKPWHWILLVATNVLCVVSVPGFLFTNWFLAGAFPYGAAIQLLLPHITAFAFAVAAIARLRGPPKKYVSILVIVMFVLEAALRFGAPVSQYAELVTAAASLTLGYFAFKFSQSRASSHTPS